MKPYFEDTKAGITIYNCDCREIPMGLGETGSDRPMVLTEGVKHTKAMAGTPNGPTKKSLI